MAHFAELDGNNLVLRVIVVSDEHEADGETWCANLLGGRWKQTSYDGQIRKNHASIGSFYDEVRDAFIAPKPYNSWILDEETCKWVAPIKKPEGSYYAWSDDAGNWVNTFPLAGYGLDADPSLIEDAVRRYDLPNFKIKTVFSCDDFQLMLQRVNNLIFFHANIQNYNRSVHDQYGAEVNKLQIDLDVDIYTFSNFSIEQDLGEVDKLTRFSGMFGGEAKEDFAAGPGRTYRILTRTKDRISGS